MDRLLKIEDVSGRTGVPAATLRYWRHRGIGPLSTKIGARVVYREADVEAWLAQRFSEAVGDPTDGSAAGGVA